MMRSVVANDVRNIVFVSHAGHGTTSLGDAMLFCAQETTRLGKVDDGTSAFDFEPEEIKRQSSISTGIASCMHKGKRLTILDVPGSADFVGDADASVRVADGAVLVVSSVDGVEVRSEKLWQLVSDLELPRAVFLNKIDRERASFDRTLKEIQKDLSGSVTPLTIPIGSEKGFIGVVDLLANKAMIYKKDGSGNYDIKDVPADMVEQVNSMREALVEEVAGSNELLMEKYFKEGDLSSDDLRMGLKTGIKEGMIFPAFAGSASLNIGTQPLMDILSDSFPGSDECKASVSEDGKEEREANVNAPFSGFVFKTIADQFAGQLSVFRVLSGSIDTDSSFLNSSSDEKERFGQILFVQGKEQKSVNKASVGDIVAVAKLKNTGTGDTICVGTRPLVYTRIEPPQPVVTFAIIAKDKGEEDKIYSGLVRLREEDVSLSIGRDQTTGETLLSGMGQVHIETTLKKLFRKFKVEADISLPTIPYRETIKGSADSVTYRHKKQTGGKGQFGECTIAMSPSSRGEGFEFENGIVGGSIPRQFIPAVEKGIMERMVRGVISGYPIVDVKVRLYDGKYHAVDSSEMAFKIAGSMCFRDAFEQSTPILLEPIWIMEITVPGDNVGDIMGDISSRRGRVLGMEDKGKYTLIKAQIPLAEVQTYSNDLRSLTSGRGSFLMDFDHYEEMPREEAEKIIAAFSGEEEE
jgi:elongation factor G